MAFATPQTLSKDVATAVVTNQTSFVLRAADLGQSTFSVSGLSLPSAKTLLISHQVGKNSEERHLVRLDRTEVDALLVPATASVYLNIIRPSSTAITNAIIIEMVNQLVDLLIKSSNASVTALLNSEV